MIRCLLFDLDGTLADTREANQAAYARAFATVGHALDVQKYRAAFGLRFDEMVNVVAPALAQSQRERVRAAKAGFYDQEVGRIRPNGPLIGLLRALRSSHRTALVTTAARPNAERVLQQLDLGPEWFDTFIFGGDVAKGKPDPECYQTAIARLAARPDECLVFEDSRVGVEAAEQAGAHVIQVSVP